MPRFVAALAVLCAFGAGQVPAQDKSDLPPRFQAFAKNDRFRLVRVLGTPETPSSHQQTSAYSADGKFAVFAEDQSSGDDDKPNLRARLLVWDLAARKWPREIEIDGKNVTALVLSPDASRVYLAGQFVAGFKKVKEKEKDKEVERTVAEFGAYFGVWDIKSGAEIRSYSSKGSAESPRCAAVSHDESTIVTGQRDGAYLWSLKDGKLLGSFRIKGPEVVNELAFFPDGKRFLAGYWSTEEGKRSGAVRLWDVAKKEPLRVFGVKDSFGLVLALSISHDGKRFAIGDTRPSLSVWETDTGKEIGTLLNKKDAPEEIVANAVLTDDGKTVIGVYARLNAEPDDYFSSRLVAWEADTSKTVWSQPASYRGRAPLLIKDGKLLAGGGPNLFDAWSLKDGKRLQSWGGHKGTIHGVLSLPGGDILSAGHEGQVMTWRQNEVASKRQAHAGTIGVMALSPDKKQWLTGGVDRLVKLWGPDADKPVHEFKGHTAPVTALAFNKTGKWAVSASADRTAKFWDLDKGQEIKGGLIGHPEAINAVALSPDDLWLATACDDATIRVWPIKDGKLDNDRDSYILENHKKAVTCLAFSPDGKTLLSGSQDQTLQVWDWKKEKVTRTIPGHKNWVTSITFVDDASVLTTSDDLTICWWEIGSGKEIGRIDFGSVADCPRCVARVGADRLLVGTSNWLIYEFQMR